MQLKWNSSVVDGVGSDAGVGKVVRCLVIGRGSGDPLYGGSESKDDWKIHRAPISLFNIIGKACYR